MEQVKHLVGWKEFVTFVEWDIPRIKAKIDTGARSSALDVAGYELLADPVRGLVARLTIALNRRDPTCIHAVFVPILGTTIVRSSSGEEEVRPVLETTIRLGRVEKRIRLTVTNRASMRHRLLLGRTALAPDFLVDVSKKFLQSRRRA